MGYCGRDECADEQDALKAEIARLSEWSPIESAPKNEWILIADDKCWPPDLVRWQRERPERTIHGTRYLAVSEGWFGSPGGRSRFDVPDGHPMKATRWIPLPALSVQTGDAK